MKPNSCGRILGILCSILGGTQAQAIEHLAAPLVGEVQQIDGETIDLSAYQGKVVLVVNVASKCGFTKQYKGLQALYEKYQDRGFVILGFPCNQFGWQEPGSDADVAKFCKLNYGVTFPMFAKIDVKGKDAHPLYQRLSSKQQSIHDTGTVRWNFEKFLIGRDGKLITRFRSRVAPDAEKLTDAVELAIQK